MFELDFRLNEVAAANRRLLTRAMAHALGASDQFIEDRVRRGQWKSVHPGVYLVGVGELSWEERLLAAVLAAGDGAAASHRAALLVWGLGGIASAPLEITVPFGMRPEPEGAVLHRSRRAEQTSCVRGITVVSVERALLEVGTVVPPIVVEQAFSTAWRRHLTSPTKVQRYLDQHGGKGRRGTTRLRCVVARYAEGGLPPGSDGEVVFLAVLRRAGIEEPVRQFPIDLPGGDVAVVDFAWPRRRKLIEFVGLETHADSRAHDHDTLREDDIKSLGWELRRFAPHSLRTRPDEVARRVLRFLCTPARRID